MIGETIAHYRITAKLGEGGMGEVHRATDTRLGREVALKVAKEQFSERFVREARTIAQLNHPHVCQLYDVGPNYLVIELVEGVPLKGPLPLDKAIEYAAQILDALDAAHKKGITHRDLKPANILVTKQGVKLLDFGLAKQTVPLKETDVTRALTVHGQILGTLQYMSPEQLQGKEVDARSDLFSFGCVLYEMLTGKRAFEGQNGVSVIAAILDRPAPSIAANAPEALDRVLRRCFARDPDDRWQNARDLKSELEWISGGGATTVSTPLRKPWRERAVWIAAVAVLSGTLFFVGQSSHPPSSDATVRLTITPPEKTIFSNAMVGSIPVPQFALSPDGRAIVFGASAPGTRAILWLRPMEEVAAHPSQEPRMQNIHFGLPTAAGSVSFLREI
jgi:serine/threonine protein kinase